MKARRESPAAPADSAVEGLSPAAHATEVVRSSGTSFYWAMRLLPVCKRQAMYAIYAFCRKVDDIADSPGESGEKLRRLKDWREEIARLYAGCPKHLIARALLAPVEQFNLPEEEFHAVLDGMEIDAAGQVRMHDIDGLLDYCRKVAGAVGMLSIPVFGMPRGPGPRIAVALGNALQLTNILRDIQADADRNRLYMPTDTLEKHGVEEDSASLAIAHPAFAGACRELSGIARGYYREAEWLLKGFERAVKRPPVIMMHTYRETLKLLDRRGWEQLGRRVSLKGWRKISLALRYGLF